MKTVMSKNNQMGSRCSNDTAKRLVENEGFHYVPKSVMKRMRNKQRQMQPAQRKRSKAHAD